MGSTPSDLRNTGTVSWPAFALLFSCTTLLGQLFSQNLAAATHQPERSPLANTARDTLAWTFARLIEEAIPEHYEKKKDWDRTKNITVGIRNEGIKLYRRKKPVKHGLWKHYTVDLVEPEKNLSVQIQNLRPMDEGRLGFTLVLSAKLDIWGRARAYQYGVHLISLEVEGRTDFDLSLDCEIGADIQSIKGRSTVVIDPSVSAANLKLRNFRLDRISNAKGKLVEEIGEEIEDIIAKQLRGPKLTAKINRAIDKKRDRLQYTLPKFMDSSWWPLANLPNVQEAIDQEQRLLR